MAKMAARMREESQNGTTNDFARMAPDGAERQRRHRRELKAGQSTEVRRKIADRQREEEPLE
jgi:hypothetical protein